ncbi:MAG TPA: FmdE family protein [Anaerolineaceae bacterium]|nr:FmdE family protein [Anaerolineaceae bacterium]
MPNIKELLEKSSARHTHLCPRQVLGVRMAIAGCVALGLEVPRQDKRLMIIAETDGCFIDGLEVATGSTPGHRTLRIEDYGKVAATFIDVEKDTILRIAPAPGIRELAYRYCPGEPRHYFAQLNAYKVMPDTDLFTMTPVSLKTPIKQIVSQPGVRIKCAVCGEEIINKREVLCDGLPYCQACIGRAYYHQIDLLLPLPQVVTERFTNTVFS